MGVASAVKLIVTMTLMAQVMGIYLPRDPPARDGVVEDVGLQQQQRYGKTVEDYYNFLEALGRMYYARGRRSRQDAPDQAEFTRMYRNPDFMNNHAEAIMRGLG